MHRLAITMILALATAGAAAQTYPAKPIRAVVPYAAGGFSDAVGRVMGERLARELGQPILIESRPGGGGRIGAELVARAAPDGYTLLFTTNGTHTFMAVTEENLSYDPIRDFTPISLVGTYGLLMVVHPELPARTLPEFIEFAKRNPTKLNYGTSGLGSGIHFAGELLKTMAGIQMTHVPYRGSGPALQDTVAGIVQVTFDGAAKGMVDAGKVRLLGTTMSRRDPRFPQTPTMGEALPGYDLTYWVAVYAPPGLPVPLQQRLNTAFNTMLADPAVKTRLADMGVITVGGSPDVLVSTTRTDIDLLRKIVADTKLQVR